MVHPGKGVQELNETQETWKTVVGWVLMAAVVLFVSWVFGALVLAGARSEMVGGVMLTGQFAAPFVLVWLAVKMVQLQSEVRSLRHELSQLQRDRKV